MGALELRASSSDSVLRNLIPARPTLYVISPSGDSFLRLVRVHALPVGLTETGAVPRRLRCPVANGKRSLATDPVRVRERFLREDFSLRQFL